MEVRPKGQALVRLGYSLPGREIMKLTERRERGPNKISWASTTAREGKEHFPVLPSSISKIHQMTTKIPLDSPLNSPYIIFLHKKCIICVLF